jgi:preprotein translocase subunit SecG
VVTLALTVHVIVCIALIVVVLLQQGKGADVGAVFGGSSQTMFGASGAGNALTKTTWALAAAFFGLSMYLAFYSTQRATGSIFGGGGGSSVMHQTAPVKSVPAANVPAAAPNSAPAQQQAPAKKP